MLSVSLSRAGQSRGSAAQWRECVVWLRRTAPGSHHTLPGGHRRCEQEKMLGIRHTLKNQE